MHGNSLEPRSDTRDIACLPDELLALCFVWLSFRDRMTASHVSRLWRTISVTHPAIWADIDLSASHRDGPRLLHMALSRAGTYPVSIAGSNEPDPERIVKHCLQEHLHHVQRIRWHIPQGSLPLEIPAPLLEELDSPSYHINIPVNFLGGRPARLHTLDLLRVSLPDSCPVLSTLTTLILDGPVHRAHAETYGRLFELCPNLVSLSLHNLAQELSGLLPLGPAPPSLEKLLLATPDEAYELTPHCLAWRTNNTRRVDLIQVSGALPQLRQLVEGASVLRVMVDEDDVHIICPVARCTYAISFARAENDAAELAATLLGARDALDRLEHLVVPFAMLLSLLPVVAALPKLARLELAMLATATATGAVQHEFQWDLLPGLQRVTAVNPTVREIILHAVCADTTCPPTARDAKQLVDRVLHIAKGGGLPREVCIKGFGWDVCCGVQFDPPTDRSFDISFMCA